MGLILYLQLGTLAYYVHNIKRQLILIETLQKGTKVYSEYNKMGMEKQTKIQFYCAAPIFPF